MTSLIDAIGYYLLKTIGAFFRILPLKNALFLGRRLGDLFCVFIKKKRKKQAYLNLKAAMNGSESPKTMKMILKKMYQGFGEELVQTLRIPCVDQAYYEKNAEIQGIELLPPILEKGNGGIFLTGHFGSWEYLNIYSAFANIPIKAVARPQKMVRMDQLLNSYRRSKGCDVIYKQNAVREILKGLKENRFIGILGDQQGGPNGEFIPMFDRIASTIQGSIVLGLKAGASILPVFSVKLGQGKYRVEVNSPIELDHIKDHKEKVREGVVQYIKVLERYIKKYPDHWLWAHNKWKRTPTRWTVILSDSKAGHISQSKAVSNTIESVHREELLKTKNNFTLDQFKPEDIYRERVIEVRYKSDFCKTLYMGISLFLSFLAKKENIAKLFLDKNTFDLLSTQYADIVISCGSSLLPVNQFVSYQNNAKSVVLMNPRPFSLKRFSVVIAPFHDCLKKMKQVVQVYGACVKSKVIVKESDSQKGIGVLIGGDSKDFRFSENKVKELCQKISLFAKERASSLYVTTSRRTSLIGEAVVVNVFGNHPMCKSLVIANKNNPANTIEEIFTNSSIVVVTSESISMITEAASSGNTVLVVNLSNSITDLTPRHQLFLEQMQEQGYIKHIELVELPHALEKAFNNHWTTKLLDNTSLLEEGLRKFNW